MDVVILAFLALHFIALPITIIAALLNGLYAIAIVDGLAFLSLFVVEAMFVKKPAPEKESRYYARRVAPTQTRAASM